MSKHRGKQPRGEMNISVSSGGWRHYATLEEVRSVWNLVSENPKITIRAAAARLGTKTTTTKYIFQFLERAGYIRRKKYSMGVLVIIPLINVEK